METRFCLYCAKEYEPRIPNYPQRSCSHECLLTAVRQGKEQDYSGVSSGWVGCVYFIRCGKDGPIKIGVSGHVPPVGRLKQLQSSNPYELFLLGFIEHQESTWIERWCHEYFKEYHIRGEWFHPGDRLLALVGSIDQG